MARLKCDGGCGRMAMAGGITCGRKACQIAALAAATKFVNQNYPLPRCDHGTATRDHAGDFLYPSCGCRHAEAPGDGTANEPKDADHG